MNDIMQQIQSKEANRKYQGTKQDFNQAPAPGVNQGFRPGGGRGNKFGGKPAMPGLNPGNKFANKGGPAEEEKKLPPLKGLKKDEASKKEQEELIRQMAMSPTSQSEDNTNIDVSKTDKEKKEDKEIEKKNKEDIISLVLSGKTVGKKYKEKLVDQATKDPSSVSIKKDGKWKTVRKAMKDGDLGEMPKKPDLDKLMKDLDPETKARMMSMLDPKTTDASPEQLAELGFGKGMGKDFAPKAAAPAGIPGVAPEGAAPATSPMGDIPPEVLAAAQGGIV